MAKRPYGDSRADHELRLANEGRLHHDGLHDEVETVLEGMQPKRIITDEGTKRLIKDGAPVAADTQLRVVGYEKFEEEGEMDDVGDDAAAQWLRANDPKYKDPGSKK